MAMVKSLGLLIISLFVLFLLLFVVLNHYTKETVEFDEEYRKCTSYCAATLDEDFTTHYLCEEECKKQMMERKKA